MVRKISVSDQAYELLNRLREELGTATHSETILLLAERATAYSRLEDRLQEIEKRLAELEATTRKTYLALLRLIDELGGREEAKENTTPVKG